MNIPFGFDCLSAKLLIEGDRPSWQWHVGEDNHSGMLTWEKNAFQQGEDRLIPSPKLDWISFGVVISNGIMAPLPSTKGVPP